MLLLALVELGEIFLELEFESVEAVTVLTEDGVSWSWLRYLFTLLELVLEARE